MENLIHGLGALGSGPAIACLFAGAVIGMIVGVIPGLSTVVILSVLLIFTQNMSLTTMLCLFLGAQCGSFYSASVSAILLNTPAHPEAFPITLDGYPMARKGEPGRALGLSAASTCVGGIIGCAILVGFLQVLNSLPTLLHPPEFLALVTLAMLLVGTLGTDSIAKAIVSAGAGLMIASIGPSAITGTFRYTFGAVGLYGGVSLVAVALGVFAIPQMVMIFGTGTATARQDMTGKEIDPAETVEITGGYMKSLLGGVAETFRHWPALLQSGVVGGLSGIVPGIGGFTGNFLAYGIAKQTSRSKKKLFGTGIPEGIIAPEGSSLAKEAGHIVPIIGLGIPGGVAGALFIGALAIKGMKVGYGFQSAYPNVTGQIVWIIALSGLIGTVAGIIAGPQIARLMRVPGPMIVPFIFALSVTGAYVTDGQFFSVMELIIFAVIGIGLRRLGYPLGGLILGLVLGPTFENNFYLTHNVYPGVSWIWQRPAADVIFLICIAVLAGKAVEIRRESRQRKAEGIPQVVAYPQLAVVVSTLLLAAGVFFVVYSLANYDFATGIMPIVGGLAVAVPAAFMLPRDVYRYTRWRKDAKQAPPEEPAASPATDSRALLGVRLAAWREHSRGGPGAVGVVEQVSPLTTGNATPGIPAELAPIREKSFGRSGQYRRELIAVAWLLGLVGLCWLTGFTVGCVIFAALYGITCTRRYLRRLSVRAVFAVGAAVVLGLVAVELFRLSGITPFVPVLQL
jgi:putative tricarboxylic transport membrane protein